MTVWMNSIVLGIKAYLILGIVIGLPYEIIRARLTMKLNAVTVIFNQAFLLYISCFIALVFFPLPTVTQAMRLSTYDIQFVPFQFVADIIKERNLHSVLQVLFNIALTVPFGALLRYRFNLSASKITAFGFCLSLFAELGQLSGLFFLYSGSYRLCDIDDLMLNTLGCFVGVLLISRLSNKLPKIDEHNKVILNKKHIFSI